MPRKKKTNPSRLQFRNSLKPYAIRFLDHVNSASDIRSRCSDRNEVDDIFTVWSSSNPPPPQVVDGEDADVFGGGGENNKSTKYLCSQVMSVLRTLKLLRTKRMNDMVVCVFALSSVPNTFPPVEERKTAREEILRRRKVLEDDKDGVTVIRTDEYQGSNVLVPKGHQAKLGFMIKYLGTNRSNEENRSRKMMTVSISGDNRRCFFVGGPAGGSGEISLVSGEKSFVEIIFQSRGTGIFRAIIVFTFQTTKKKRRKTFKIARYVSIRSGDAILHDILKPTSPYQKKRFGLKMGDTSEFVQAPERDNGAPAFIQKLQKYNIPPDIQEMIDQNEMDGAIKGMAGKIGCYAGFWKRLLWTSEAQAKQDIQLYDMKSVSLLRQGRLFTLTVPGLAEGRPSVLRGDTVIVKLEGKQGYFGLVETTRLEEVVLDFHPKFTRSYQQGIHTVDVRFTFSRTTFRTSHFGASKATKVLGRRMLFPDPKDVTTVPPNNVTREVNKPLRWANQNLNAEQQKAVECVLRGSARPVPYIIFGPPGTGKTTTVVEVVYQLTRHKSRPKVLLVAPSNDAADLLVEKLSSHFPPTEMRRILAYSRTLNQVSVPARPYAREGLSGEAQMKEITSSSARVVVSTVNLAARFAFLGVEVNHFDVLCVDEAGHATEPEVIAVAATMFDFSSDNNNNNNNKPDQGNDSSSKKRQVILAGDPRQLGPIISSDLCKAYGMDVSYMERLSERPLYTRGNDGTYQSHVLTKLVENYRSHPAILKLPNELFYDNELKQCGSQFVTHSMAQWEHLPNKGYPVLFHAISGENLREGNSPSWFNPQEAQEVVNYVDLLMKQSTPAVDAANIGVVTPYARQAQKIRMALKTRDLGDVKVGSVETFQGQERRVIIISTVRAVNDYIEHDKKYNLGFVSNVKRFNVAVTRAQALLIVIGQPTVLATDKETWLPFLRMCRDNQSWVGEEWDEGSDSSGGGEDDLLASAMEDVHEEEEDISGENNDDDDWVIDGMDRLSVSRAVEQEGLGYVNREE